MEYLESTFKLKVKRLQWQKRGLQQTATGYGSKLTTKYMILPDGGKIWLRVYACCYSNAASFYIMPKRSTVWIRDWQLEEARDNYTATITEGKCAYCGKAIWKDTDGWRHDHPGSMPICNHIPEPRV